MLGSDRECAICVAAIAGTPNFVGKYFIDLEN
jgi:hypothetical protein